MWIYQKIVTLNVSLGFGSTVICHLATELILLKSILPVTVDFLDVSLSVFNLTFKRTDVQSFSVLKSISL